MIYLIQNIGLEIYGNQIVNYNIFINEIRTKYSSLEKILDKESYDRIMFSLSNYNSIHEYAIALAIIPYLKPLYKITILASWFSIPILEPLINSKINFHSVTLLDHDPNVSKMGNHIKKILKRDNSIRYVRKDVIFDDIQNEVNQSNIIIIPSVNRLLPIKQLLPNIKKDTIICLAGNNNTLRAYNINPIFSIDDLRHQISFSKEIYSHEFTGAFTNSLPLKTSVLVGQV